MTNETQTNHPSEATGTASHEARKLRDAAQQEAQSLKDRVTEEAGTRAEGAKDTMADEVSSIGDAFRTASGELRRGSMQEQMFSTVAESLADFSDAVRGRSVSDLVHEVTDFGRRNPAAFLGGAALVGFAVVRAARASQRHPSGHQPETSTADMAATRTGGAPAPTAMPTAAADLPRDEDT